MTSDQRSVPSLYTPAPWASAFKTEIFPSNLHSASRAELRFAENRTFIRIYIYIYLSSPPTTDSQATNQKRNLKTKEKKREREERKKMPGSSRLSSHSSSRSSRFVWPFSLHSASKLDQYRMPTFVSTARRSSSSRTSSTQTSLEPAAVNGSARVLRARRGAFLREPIV
ncbi:hypothetical protein F5Y05DRAFT_385347 [Hypoxylon sp. FL0543]|nr:hypothetical protein F5Y05DRAFT_385347 [Hypoxylon sp. FL0543]